MSTITVRRASVKDAAAYARVMSHPEVFPQLLQVPFNDEELWKARLAESATPGKPDLHLVAELDGEVVGNGGLHPAASQLRRRHAMALGIAVAHEAQGRGVGSALMHAMCDYADNWVQVLRMELSVFTDNHRAMALYRKFGFEVEGTHRGYAMRHGQYVDVHSMARWHPAPPRVSAPG
ncbi:GNAT family N-acetyltransferase [Ideonella sp. BN130291]|uniref:GNAT family N-acetyltransferase n=1 Tax=Ideonella sp. BN130291 TaxID=3112940 RepID=UPI002E25894E|nr:GNAT family N-acetyltransferase [Ideonella sp. BN130291]